MLWVLFCVTPTELDTTYRPADRLTSLLSLPAYPRHSSLDSSLQPPPNRVCSPDHSSPAFATTIVSPSQVTRRRSWRLIPLRN